MHVSLPSKPETEAVWRRRPSARPKGVPRSRPLFRRPAPVLKGGAALSARERGLFWSTRVHADSACVPSGTSVFQVLRNGPGISWMAGRGIRASSKPSRDKKPSITKAGSICSAWGQGAWHQGHVEASGRVDRARSGFVCVRALAVLHDATGTVQTISAHRSRREAGGEHCPLAGRRTRHSTLEAVPRQAHRPTLTLQLLCACPGTRRATELRYHRWPRHGLTDAERGATVPRLDKTRSRGHALSREPGPEGALRNGPAHRNHRKSWACAEQWMYPSVSSRPVQAEAPESMASLAPQ